MFSERGTSASHFTAVKFLHTMSRFPSMKGEDADATSAYTQVLLADMTHIVEKGIMGRDSKPHAPNMLGRHWRPSMPSAQKFVPTPIGRLTMGETRREDFV